MKKLYTFKYALIAAATMFAGVSCDKDVDDPSVDPGKDPVAELIEPFAMEQSEDGMSIAISYDSEAEKYKYATAVCSIDDADNVMNADDPYAAICDLLEDKDIDLSKVDGEYIFRGDAVVDLAAWDVDFESDYIIAAVAYDDEMKQVSKVASLEFTTPEEPAPASFATVEVSDAREGGFTVTVDVHDYDGCYTIIPTTQDDIDYIGSLEEYVEAFLADDIDTYATDYSVVDDAYVFSGDYVFETEDGWNLNPGVAFKAIVVGVEGDGTYAEVVTDIVLSDEITTLESEGGSTGGEEYPTDIVLSSVDFGSIELSDVTSSSFAYSIEPADQDMPYLIFAFTDEEYNTTFPTDEERIVAIYSTYAALAPYYGYSFAEFVAGSSAPGDYADVYEDMDSASTYHVIAFGLDLDTYQPVSAVEEETVTTLEPAPITESLASVTVSDVTFDNATITIDAGSYSGYYTMYPIAADILDDPDTTTGYAGDTETAIEETADYLIGKGYEFDPEFAYAYLYYFTGSQEIQLNEIVWLVEPETDYYLLVAGFDADGNRTTSVLKSEMFTTGVAPEFTIDIEVSNISDTCADVTFTPSVKSVDYYNNIVLKSDYEAGMTPESIAEADPYFVWFLSYGDLVYDSETVELLPGTDYVVIAFAYDVDNEMVISEMFTEEFTTTGTAAAAPAKAMMKPSVERTKLGQKSRLHTIAAPSKETQVAMTQKAASLNKPESKITDRVAKSRFTQEAIRPATSCRKIAR